MNTTVYGPKLLERMNWYEYWAEHLAEQATLDSQSNFGFRLALEKLAAVKRNLKRLARGEFGRCEACGALIPDERLDVLLDSDDHWCTRCAATHGVPARQRVPVKPIMSQRRSAPASAALAPV